MIKNLINEFRIQNGRHSANMNFTKQNQHCLWHCLYMSGIQEFCDSLLASDRPIAKLEEVIEILKQDAAKNKAENPEEDKK